MGMFNYGNFAQNKAPVTPDFSGATAQQGNLENQAKARVDSLRTTNMMGGLAGIKGYNAYMGDKTPIADAMGFGEGAGVAAGTSTAGGAPAGWSAMAPVAETAIPTAAAGGGEAATAADALYTSALADAGVTTGAAGAIPTAGGTAAAGTAGGTAAGGGLMSGLAAATPYGLALAAALAADEALLDGKGRELVGDATGALFGKGWLWD